MKRAEIVLIDGSSYFFRAYYAIRQLTTSKGVPTNALYGFINMLLKVLEVEEPKRIAIVFDSPKPTFRKELYTDYKANRTAPPDDLLSQIPHIQRAVDAFRIYRIQRDGMEADDLIASMARKAQREGLSVEIISGDKDLMQLVGPGITLYDTMKDKRYDAKAVEEKFGVTPEQMVDLLALMGDSSDNVPGVKGVGEKTAAELLKQFGSLDGIYERLEEIKQPKRRETLAAEKQNALLSRQLVRLDESVPLDFSWDDLEYRGPDRAKLASLCEEFEFQALVKRLGLESSAKPVTPSGEYRVVIDPDELRGIVRELMKAPLLSVDTETTSLDTQSADLVGISLTAETGKAYYVPIGHRLPEGGAPPQMDGEKAKEILRPLFESQTPPKVGQNLKYDMQVLRRWGVRLGGIVSDTLIASYLLDPDQPHNLDALAKRVLGRQTLTYEDVCGRGKGQICFAEVPIDKAAAYSGEDVDVTLQLHERLVPELGKQGLGRLYHEVEVPLVEVLAEMEFCGVAVDEPRLEKMGRDLEKEILEVQEEIYRLAGGEFNVNSPKQLQHVLFEKLKLPSARKTKTGLSTDERVMHELAKHHAIAERILKNRELVKLKSTYVDGLLSQIHPRTRRIHTHFNQTVTATGRLSSSNPNLQNIPITKEERYDIRSVFVAESGCELLSADYSQVELRILAHMSEDAELVAAFRRGDDVHRHTASLIFGGAGVTAEQRRIAKTINFGVVYGQTPFGLSQQLGITPSEAKQFIESYFARYPGVKRLMARHVEEARSRGYAVTALGRRRYLPELRSHNRMRREMAERTAINTPLQGTAADMIKVAMVAIHRRLAREGRRARMILQVHDELVFEVPAGERAAVEPLVREEMERALPLDVPLVVDTSWGPNWRKGA